MISHFDSLDTLFEVLSFPLFCCFLLITVPAVVEVDLSLLIALNCPSLHCIDIQYPHSSVYSHTTETMDNPNTGVSFRRHNSLRIDPRRRSTAVLDRTRHQIPHSRSNPYVGWFRHAPSTVRGSPLSSCCTKQRKQPKFVSAAVLPHSNSPHVGWFRHAPPAVRLSSQFSYNNSSNNSNNSNNSSSIKEQPHWTTDLERELVSILKQIPPTQNKTGVLELRDLLSGHLKGGGTTTSSSSSNMAANNAADYYAVLTPHDRDQTLEYFCRSLQASSAGSSSVTLKMLTKVICWFLLPVHDHDNNIYTASPCWFHRKSLGGWDEETITSYGETITLNDEHDEEFDNYDTVSGSAEPSPLEELGSSISSQAEAYYAHRSAEELIDQSTTSLGGHHHHHNQGSHPQNQYPHPQDTSSYGDHRLDYVITQMDIARMARNASRHLDVESITQLPTITYRGINKVEEESQEQQQQQPQEESPAEGWSWMMIQRGLDVRGDDDDQAAKDSAASTSAANTRDKEQDVCVICLEHFCNGDRLRVLPCNHSFHVGCIDRWLSGSHSFDDCVTSGCPTCKKHPCDESAAAYKEQSQSSSDGSVPSWAFARIGSVLAQDSRHF